MLAEISTSMKSKEASVARLETRIETNGETGREGRQADQEDPNRMVEEMNTKMDANQAEMRSTVCACQSELDEIIQREMKPVTQPIRSELDETAACKETTEAKPDQGLTQSIEEHQEISKREATVTLIKEPRKRCRVFNLAACAARRRRKEPGEIVEPGGSRLLQQEGVPMRTNHSAKLTRGNEHGLHRQAKDNSAPRIPTGRTSRMRRWIGPECNNDIRDRGLKQKLQGRSG
jgi:hypothetical protein